MTTRYVPPKRRAPRTQVVEDALWLLDTGESGVAIAARLGYASRASLERVLDRAGRHDIARALRASRRVAVGGAA